MEERPSAASAAYMALYVAFEPVQSQGSRSNNSMHREQDRNEKHHGFETRIHSGWVERTADTGNVQRNCSLDFRDSPPHPWCNPSDP